MSTEIARPDGEGTRSAVEGVAREDERIGTSNDVVDCALLVKLHGITYQCVLTEDQKKVLIEYAGSIMPGRKFQVVALDGVDLRTMPRTLEGIVEDAPGGR